MKIYTKKGDGGNTSLYGGDRVQKSSPRIEAYGTVDELNSWIGLALSQEVSEEGDEILTHVQDHLLILGADLATPMEADTRIERIGDVQVSYLEKKIDRLQEGLPELKNFVLPGGVPAAAHLHVARTVCRRTERMVVRCSDTEQISQQVLKYLNRLSDLLFVAARFENMAAGEQDTLWRPPHKP